MDWIFEHLNIVVVIILVIGSFLKSRFDSMTGETGERDDFPDTGETNTPPGESYRKIPPRLPSVPPPLVSADRPPSLPATAYDTPGAFVIAEAEAAKILKHQRDLADHMRQLRETKASTSGGAAITRARIAADNAGKQSSVETVPISYRSRLRSPAEIRRAIVMREILDRPVALR